MISAIVILSLISLLVATDPEPTGTSVQPTPEPPLRPEGRKSPPEVTESERIAA